MEELHPGRLGTVPDEEWIHNVAEGLHQQYPEKSVDQWTSIVYAHAEKLTSAYREISIQTKP